MNDEDKIAYLANLLAVARADGRVTPNEMQAITNTQKRIGATKTLLSKAQTVVETTGYMPSPVGLLSTRISNLEDMIVVSLMDGKLDQAEELVILEFARKAGVTKEQFQIIIAQVKTNMAPSHNMRACPSCAASVSEDAKFCPACGSSLTKSDQESAVLITYKIPVKGVAIEFSESSASGFADAVKRAQGAPINATCIRGKKTWYLAAWPREQIGEAAKLVGDIKGMRNRKVWVDGQESHWDDVFGFVWCSEQRNTAYRPVEYCFGIDEKRFNVWGCKQANMDWVIWGNWFSYGQFRKAGVLNKQVIFAFDKKRIRHELEQNLFRFRFCPHLNFRLIDAVLDAIPDEVEVKANGPWKYKEDYEQSPGSIQIIEKVTEDGYSFEKKYYSSGVVPRSPKVGLEILRKALHTSGASESQLTSVLAYRGE
ncbi:MAG: zinc ribbon domain-containing protein [Gammaproteobacteria bacterium]